MSNDGSVAPKERVNIVYRPASGDQQTDVELPLKVMVVGDFTLHDDAESLEEKKPISVDKDNFNEVLKAQKINLQFNVPNKLMENGTEDDQLSLNISINSINDFTPDALVEQVPELRQMIELRDALKALKGPLGNLPDFRKRLQEIVSDESIRQRLMAELGDKKSD